MAGAACWNPFALKALPAAVPAGGRSHCQLPCGISVAGLSTSRNGLALKSGGWGQSGKSLFPARAMTDDDEWEMGAGEEESGGVVGVAEEDTGDEMQVNEVGELKKKLKDLLNGTDLGLKASSERRAEIGELITQLEARNPIPAPTEALTLLNGKWNLVYTSLSQLFRFYGSGRLPEVVKVEEISQTIDSEAFTIENSVRFAGLLATTSVTGHAKFEIRSPKRIQMKFQEGIIGTPQLKDSSIEIPDKVEVLGQNIDFSPFKGAITSIRDAGSSVVRTISGRPPLKVPINNINAEVWIVTTYLDEDLRITRGDDVLIKDGSSLLN